MKGVGGLQSDVAAGSAVSGADVSFTSRSPFSGFEGLLKATQNAVKR